MDEVSILLKYSGFWIEENIYDTKHIEGLVIRSDISFTLLKTEIANHIGIDLSRKTIRMRYVVDSNTVPMEIRNEMGVRLYISLKKNIADFSKYPLCIDTYDLDIVNINSVGEAFDTATGSINCIESFDECRALMVLEKEGALTNDSNQLMQIISNPNFKKVEVNQTYKDKEIIVSVMHNYALENRFQFHAKRSEPKCYELICYVDKCPWHFRASRIKKSKLFKVRKFNNTHTCPLPERGFTQRQATTKIVASVCIPQLKNHKRKHTPNDIKDDVKKIMGVDISYNKAWRAKELALKILMGGPADGYLKLPIYLHMLGTYYPGSYLKLNKTDKNQFMYLFIALHPSIRGFDHCRPIVVVDGSHLRGPYLGTFISASTLDGAGNILPLAYGVVDSENDKFWTWFFQQFRGAFGVRPDMAIVSDRNESIWKSERIVFPEIPHFACMWHVWKNVCKHYRRSQETLSSLYYAMGKSYKQDEFMELMAQLDSIDHRVKIYLDDIGYEKWARSYASVNRGRMTTSNIAECINSCLVDARKLPFLEFLEKVRELFAKWNCVNGEKARYMAASRLGDRFQEILMINDMKSTRLTAVKSSDFLYSVDGDGVRYIICIQKNTCTCGRFQYDGVPCEHAIAVLKSKQITYLMPYCSDYYKKETLMKIYENPFPPMPQKNQWNAPESSLEDIVLPPIYKRPPGRPRNGRVKNNSETLKSTTNSCGKCGRAGHNRRSCSFFPKEY